MLVFAFDISKNNIGWAHKTTCGNIDIKISPKIERLGLCIEQKVKIALNGLKSAFNERLKNMSFDDDYMLVFEYSNLFKGSNINFYTGILSRLIWEYFKQYTNKDISIKYVNPSSWKAKLGLHQQRIDQKKMSIALANKFASHKVYDDNAADAMCILEVWDQVKGINEDYKENLINKDIKELLKQYRKENNGKESR